MASPAEQNARNVDERGTIATGESHTSERPKAAADSMYNAIEYNKYQVLSVSLGEVLQWIFAIVSRKCTSLCTSDILNRSLGKELAESDPRRAQASYKVCYSMDGWVST